MEELDKSLNPLSASQLESLEEAVAMYEASLDSEAARYLVGRGLSGETVRTFRVGVVDQPAPGHEGKQGMLAIPYLDRKGNPLTIRFRNLSGSGPKYLSLPGDRERMFNVGAIFQADHTIHVTEGEFDAMILNQIGLPAVAIPGASGFQARHRRMLMGFNRIWVWGDPDEAGARFTNQVINALPRSAKGAQVRGGDISEVFVASGAQALLDLVQEDRYA